MKKLIDFLISCEPDTIGNEMYIFLPFEHLAKFRALTEDFFEVMDIKEIVFTSESVHIPISELLQFYEISPETILN